MYFKRVLFSRILQVKEVILPLGVYVSLLLYGEKNGNNRSKTFAESVWFAGAWKSRVHANWGGGGGRGDELLVRDGKFLH